jgi:hypothetical protein
MCAVGLVTAAQYINEWAMANWAQFAAKPYFTKNGFFVSMIFSFPLLILAILITVPLSHHYRTARARTYLVLCAVWQVANKIVCL